MSLKGVWRRILKGLGFGPRELEGPVDSASLDKEIGELYGVSMRKHPAEWTSKLWEADIRAASGVLARLHATGFSGAEAEAYRETARAVIEHRLTNRVVEQMIKLERVGSILTIVGIGIAVLGLMRK